MRLFIVLLILTIAGSSNTLKQRGETYPKQITDVYKSVKSAVLAGFDTLKVPPALESPLFAIFKGPAAFLTLSTNLKSEQLRGFFGVNPTAGHGNMVGSTCDEEYQ